MTVEGVDYADDRPSPSGLKAAGKVFAVRYGGPGRDSKQLHAAELAALRAAGIDVVANAEGAAEGFTGRAAGRSWAQQAQDHFGPLGIGSRPIYFSVDWGTTSADWPDIDAALRGAAEIIGAARVGVYGGYRTIAHCVSAGTARWFWQTLAWSDGRWHPRNNIEQYRNAVGLAGATLDLDRALTADYGQWGYQPEDSVTPEEIAAVAQAVASKIGVDLNNPASGIALGTIARSRDAYNQFWSDAYHASMQDSTYTTADAGTQQRMRFARDIARGTVGGPVSEANLQLAISNVDEEVWAKVPDPAISAAEKADLLRAVLGDDAAAVGALLAAG